ncbi:MAG TPA: hydroxyacid dehydrogenase [Candidatus Dormibacteraeota bacterium]|nr:hydroxyacid dehydrogenase [Candidatus Dormibacteraeota bacterium]
MKIVVTDPIHEDGIARLRQEHEVTLLFGDRNAESSDAALAHADALVIRGFPISGELLDRCPRLVVIGKHGSGVDNVDLNAASERGVVVANTPGGANATAVAEGAVALMLAVLRRVLDCHRAVTEGRFGVRDEWRLSDLWGHTLGLIGCGNIGAIVARMCRQGFDMRVLVYDPTLSRERAGEIEVEKVETLHDLMKTADVVSIHVPLSDRTRGLVSASAIAAMKPTAILVNTSRGPIVDEDALIAALAEGRIKGAGIDVFQREPPDADSSLLRLPNVTLSPHNAGLTEDSTRDMGVRIAEYVLQALAGEKPPTLLNPQIWDTRRSYA